MKKLIRLAMIGILLGLAVSASAGPRDFDDPVNEPDRPIPMPMPK